MHKLANLKPNLDRSGFQPSLPGLISQFRCQAQVDAMPLVLAPWIFGRNPRCREYPFQNGATLPR